MTPRRTLAQHTKMPDELIIEARLRHWGRDEAINKIRTEMQDRWGSDIIPTNMAFQRIVRWSTAEYIERPTRAEIAWERRKNGLAPLDWGDGTDDNELLANMPAPNPHSDSNSNSNSNSDEEVPPTTVERLTQASLTIFDVLLEEDLSSAEKYFNSIRERLIVATSERDVRRAKEREQERQQAEEQANNE